MSTANSREGGSRSSLLSGLERLDEDSASCVALRLFAFFFVAPLTSPSLSDISMIFAAELIDSKQSTS